jgi:hypothetical protein
VGMMKDILFVVWARAWGDWSWHNDRTGNRLDIVWMSLSGK